MQHRAPTPSAAQSIMNAGNLMSIENGAVLTRMPEARRDAGEFELGFAGKACGKPRSDDFFAAVTPRTQEGRAQGALFAVADGVSGDGGGRVAAELTVRSLLNDYYMSPAEADVPAILAKALSAMNTWLFAQNSHQPPTHGMLTTASLLVLKGGRYCIAHVGDTRIYRLRGRRVEQLTADHVWPRSDMHHVLKRALGLDHYLVADLVEGEIRSHDTFALVSDGVWEVLGDKALHQILRESPDPRDAADALVNEAVVRQLQYLGRNDATAIVVRTGPTPP